MKNRWSLDTEVGAEVWAFSSSCPYCLVVGMSRSVVLAFADFYCSRQSSGTVFRYRLFAEGSLDKTMMFMHRRKFSCMDMMLLCHFSSRSKKGKCLPSEFKYSLTADWPVHWWKGFGLTVLCWGTKPHQTCRHLQLCLLIEESSRVAWQIPD